MKNLTTPPAGTGAAAIHSAQYNSTTLTSDHLIFEGIDRAVTVAYLNWRNAHPRPYGVFEELALDAWDRGFPRIGGQLIFEKMRWELMITGYDGSAFKLNNNFISRLAREVMFRNPRVNGLFELRSGGDQ